MASLRKAALGDHIFVRPLEDTGLTRLDPTTIPSLDELYSPSDPSVLPSPRVTSSPEDHSVELPGNSTQGAPPSTPGTSSGHEMFNLSTKSQNAISQGVDVMSLRAKEAHLSGSMSPLSSVSSPGPPETNPEMDMKQELDSASISLAFSRSQSFRGGSMSSLSSISSPWTQDGADGASATSLLRRTKRKSNPPPAFQSKRAKREDSLPFKRPVGYPRKRVRGGRNTKSRSQSTLRSYHPRYHSCYWPEPTATTTVSLDICQISNLPLTIW